MKNLRTVLILTLALPTFAATPPTLVNYQGVLRDQNDNPLSGTYDVTFRFMDAAAAGNEIMVDQHTAATSNAVAVTGGMLNVALGSGTIADGSGSGSYTALDAVFADYGTVWLEIIVGGEMLVPRTPIRSAPYALNASQLGGQPASAYVDTSGTQQSKNGRLNITNSNNNEPAIDAQDNSQNGTGVRGSGGLYGVYGSGGTYGLAGFSSQVGAYGSGDLYGVFGRTSGFSAYAGYFLNTNTSFGTGVYARAPSYGGHFENSSGSNVTADIATTNSGVSGNAPAYGGIGVYGSGGTVGIWGAGGDTGGQFSGGGLGAGVSASGPTGGRFYSTSMSGTSVELASPNYGVNASSSGTYAGYFQATGSALDGVYASGPTGGHFESTTTIGNFVNLATPSAGVEGAAISGTGGYFTSSSGSGVYASGTGYGVRAHGNSIGAFIDSNGGGQATLATSDNIGISTRGTLYGGYFANASPYFSYAYIPSYDHGIEAYGGSVGGAFHNFNVAGSFAWVSYNNYKIYGSGTMSFVQNHPSDASKVVVYSAPEGDEVAVYTRGSGRLVNGEATVRLGATFALVTNPDIGLTATATPRGEPVPLAVSRVSPSELAVRGPAGSTAEFDYMVWGLRIGFEEQSIVQPKPIDAKIPSMQMHEKFFEAEPALRTYTAISRFESIEGSVRGRTQIDLSHAAGLRDAIGVGGYNDTPSPPVVEPGGPIPDETRAASAATIAPSRVERTARSTDGAQNVASKLADDLDRFSADETLEAGDVVSLSPTVPGSVVRSAGPDDALVVGCVQADETRVMPAGLVAVATSHVALCRVTAEFGAVAIGDRLVPSSTLGTAMKLDPKSSSAAILGRAIEPLQSGASLLRVLLGAR